MVLDTLATSHDSGATPPPFHSLSTMPRWRTAGGTVVGCFDAATFRYFSGMAYPDGRTSLPQTSTKSKIFLLTSCRSCLGTSVRTTLELPREVTSYTHCSGAVSFLPSGSIVAP
jgi:hypothetical protein